MRRDYSDIALRGGGSLLILVAIFAAHGLPGPAAVVVEGAAPLSAYRLALLAFLCASGGAALLFWGAHLFDRVAPSPRWKQYRFRERDG